MKYSLKATILILILVVAALLGAGCTGSGSGGGSGVTGSESSGTTTISGKVTLSSSVQAGLKPTMQSKLRVADNMQIGKPGSKSYSSSQRAVLGSSLRESAFGKLLDATTLTNAVVDLYDANHPEWLLPVASTRTDALGNYSLLTMINSEYNKGATYANGDAIPTGLYTLVAYKVGVGVKPVVSVQAVVNKYDGFSNVDFEVVDSDIEPTVETMFGVLKNNDGTNTWGSSSLMRATNSAIQVSFSMPMWRESLQGISISPAVEGNWSLSADWRTATFYLKTGTTLDPNTVYTVKVNGADTTNPVYNVYTNAIRTTAVGYFKTSSGTDSQNPTAQWMSPSLYDMSKLVDISTPLQVMVNEPLDVNGLYIDATPTLGARSSVIFIGTTKDSSGNILYIYEFCLGVPLALNTPYDLKVLGGKDLAGNSLNVLNASITTKSAADYNAGIDMNATQSTQDEQALIYDVFGKWARSMDKRNLTLFQSLMTGDFYMEYDTIKGVSSDDKNHDGRFSLYEFTEMIKKAFKSWDYCNTGIKGHINPGTYITIGMQDPTTGVIDMNLAGLEFRLDATSTVQSQQCSDNAPKDNFYMTLQKINGTWTIRRASEGINNLAKTPNTPDGIKTALYESAAGKLTLIADGGQIKATPSGSYGMKFNWDPVAGVQSLVFALIDARTSCTGIALALPKAATELSINKSMLPEIVNSAVANYGAVDVTPLFGLDGQSCNNGMMMAGGGQFSLQPGGEYYWEVLGFKTTDLTTGASNAQTIMNDISAASTLKRFSIMGLFKELTVYVKSAGVEATYSDVLGGYDVGGEATVQLTIYSPNASDTTPPGSLNVSGHSSNQYPLVFDSTGKVTVNVSLFKGRDVFWIDDGAGLYRTFFVYTTGGLLPAIGFTLVTDDTGGPALTGGAWDYYQTHSGAKRVTIQGTANPPGACSMSGNMNYNVYNWKLGASSQGNIIPDIDGNFTIGMDIYQGENWVQIYGTDSCGNWHNRQIGVSTDTGTTWVPPIVVSSVRQASKIADYGQRSDWDATADLDNRVMINMKFKLCNGTEVPQVNINTWSDGGNQYYSSGNNFSVDMQGNANLYIPVYRGLNQVNINSWYNSGSCSSAWYGLNIKTQGGIPVVKTEIKTVNGSPLNFGSATVNTCTAQITGTTEPGMVTVYWRGYDGSQYYYENSRQVVADTTTNTFTVTVPVVSGTYAYNVVDVYNKNWVSTSAWVYTTANCSYVAPTFSVQSVFDGTTPLNQLSGYYQAGGANWVTIKGITNKPGQAITASLYTCNNNIDYYSTNASNTAVAGSYSWSLTVKVYDVYNYFNLSDGSNSLTTYVQTSNGVPMQPGTVIDSLTDQTGNPIAFTTGNCGAVTANTGNATTVNISGTTNEPNSRGYYNTNFGAAPFFFNNGRFSISNLALYSVPETVNNITLFNAYGNWLFDAQLTSSNGVSIPKYVDITSPLHNDVVSASSFTVTAELADPLGGGWTPNYFEAIVYDTVTGAQAFYSSDPVMQAANGYLPIKVNPGTPVTVSILSDRIAIDTANSLEIGVAGFDTASGVIHVDIIFVNNTSGQAEYYYKPGTLPKPSAANLEKTFKKSVMEHIKMREALLHQQ